MNPNVYQAPEPMGSEQENLQRHAETLQQELDAVRRRLDELSPTAEK